MIKLVSWVFRKEVEKWMNKSFIFSEADLWLWGFAILENKLERKETKKIKIIKEKYIKKLKKPLRCRWNLNIQVLNYGKWTKWWQANEIWIKFLNRQLK